MCERGLSVGEARRATLSQTARAVRSGQTSARAEVERALRDAHTIGKKLNALTQVFDQRAMRQAEEIDRRVGAGEDVGALAGVAVVLKDNICLDFGRTTCASRMLEHYESPFTATAAQRLIDAGAVIVAKANMDEFGMGSSGENSCFGATRNPWDESRVPGGSSSGTAASVAAGIVDAGLGSDTGGSIRMPAGLCGIVGFKPTYGRVSRYGLVAYASSLDQIGPMTGSVEDAAVIGMIISGVDERDATTADLPVGDWVSGLEDGVQGMTIGVPTFVRDQRSMANHPGVNGAMARAISVLERGGARVVDVELSHAGEGIAAYYLVACAEASSNLARYDGVRFGRRAKLHAGEGLEALYTRSRGEGFGAEVQRRIMLGTHALSSGYAEAYYATALKVRRLIKGDFDRAFIERGCAAVLMPSSPTPAFKIGEKTSDPLAMYMEDVYTVGVNLAGLPGITVAGGTAEVDGARLPVGVQLVGAAFEEGRLLRVARAVERGLSAGC